MAVLPWSTPLSSPPSRCVTCRCLICFRLPIPARAQEKQTHVRTRSYYDDAPARRQANSISCSHFCFAKIFGAARLQKNRSQTATKFLFEKAKCCFSDLTCDRLPRACSGRSKEHDDRKVLPRIKNSCSCGHSRPARVFDPIWDEPQRGPSGGKVPWINSGCGRPTRAA